MSTKRLMSRAQQLLFVCVLLIGVAACSSTSLDPLQTWSLGLLNDGDGDGWVDCAVFSADAPLCDCNDLNPAINPAQKDDTCNGQDEDCNKEDDQNAEHQTWYLDADGDGYAADSAAGELTCNGPPTEGQRYTTQRGDCDDSNAARNPALKERCDGVDNNCNDTIDDGPTVQTAYLDADGDGYGSSEKAVHACAEQLPSDAVYLSEDCDDAAEDRHPNAEELCNGIDDDCDDLSDLEDGLYAYRVYPDNDGDGYLDRSKPYFDCDVQRFMDQQNAPASSDCNDQADDIHPDQNEEEECDDERDLNCNGTLATADLDGDGFTLCTESKDGEPRPDCEPSNPHIHPDASELCDGEDNDCNGDVDDLDTELVLYPDGDKDGYGAKNATPVTLTGCQTVDPDSAYVLDLGDCDDDDDSRSPGVPEACNGIDDDCDDIIDDGLPLQSWYPDADGDGFGTEESLEACAAPSGYAAYSGDCNDDERDATAPAIHPYANESCTSTEDLNCDGKVEAATDNDGDGLSPCEGDCNDDDGTIYPGATEICNGVDDNCDLAVDNQGSVPWYKDFDLDGFPVSTSQTYLIGCKNPGWTQTKTPLDCDDKDSNRSPDTAESCDDKDNDCDMQVDEELTCPLPVTQEVSP